MNDTMKCSANNSLNDAIAKSMFYRCSYLILLITVFINVTIPKAGIKLGGIPLTVGNVFLLLLIGLWFCYVLWKRSFVLSRAEIMVVISILYWIGRFLLVFIFGRESFGSMVGYMVPVVIYPFTFLCINYFITEKSQIDTILKMLFWGTSIVFVFGFLQAAFGITKFSIPGITVNYSDYIASENWYAEKYNGVQEGVTYAKTVSTYQNGNLLGVNVLLFVPMVYESIKKKNIRRIYLLVFTLFCLLTGSKTCWVGIVLYLFIKALPYLNRKWMSKRKVQVACFAVGAIPVIAIMFLNTFPQIVERFQDSFTLANIDDLSGRAVSMNELIDYFAQNVQWILTGPYGLTSYWGSSYEMTYFCILMVGGLFGLIAFLGPIIFIVVKYILPVMTRSRVLIGVVEGVLVYLIVAYVEGALWLPPTAINIWMVLAVGYKLAGFLREEPEVEMEQ